MAFESLPWAPGSIAALAKRRLELLYGILGVDFPFELGARESGLEVRACVCSGELVQEDRGFDLA